MVDIADLIQTFFLNLAIISACVWVFLRAVEKVFDIAIKDKQYKRLKGASE